MGTAKTKGRYIKWLIAAGLLLLAGAAVVWYIFTEKFEDTKRVQADYTVNATGLIKEFLQDEKAANKKYAEKIIIVNGTVSEIKNADTTSNIIMTDMKNGDYIIFAFQQQHLAEARLLKTGEPVSIKGSCSGGNYSDILGVESINFKRCTVNK
jgi:hypothetical protein